MGTENQDRLFDLPVSTVAVPSNLICANWLVKETSCEMR